MTKSMRYLKSKFRPTRPEKYLDPNGLNNIIARSSWERIVMIYIDNSESVLKWGSEVVVIPYISKLDGKTHRYFVDFYLEMKDGKKLLIEIKPDKQTKAPSQTKNYKRYLNEVATYSVNISKWEQAKIWANKHGAEFFVWTELDLKRMGMPIDVSKSFKVSMVKGMKNGTR